MSQQDDDDFKRIAPYVQRNLELEQKVTELTNKLAAAEAARCDCGLFETTDNEQLTAMLAKERQSGRDEVLKELSEQPAVAWIEHHKGGDNIGWDEIEHSYAKPTPLIIRPQPPKEQ